MTYPAPAHGITPGNGCYCGAGCEPWPQDRHPLIHGERDLVAKNIHDYGGMLDSSELDADGKAITVVTDIDSLAKWDALAKLPEDAQEYAMSHGGKADPKVAEARAFARDYTGHNSFVLDIKDKVTPPRRGRLTPKMVEALLKVRDREAERESSITPADREERAALEAFLTAQAPSNSFAASLLEGLHKWGALTENQLAAVRRMMAQGDAQATLRAAPQAIAQKAGEGYYRHEGEIFKVVESQAGRLYAKRLHVADGDATWEYEAGAISKLSPGDALSLEDAQAFGKLYGICACCARRLTNEESIERGIGPICAEKL